MGKTNKKEWGKGNCWKTSYPTYYSANKVCQIQNKTRRYRNSVSVHPYKCPQCHQYHITHQNEVE